MESNRRLLVLIILDGWGERPEREYNAIACGNTPYFCGLKERYPYTQLETSGEAVGLPAGQMGNSEVGHLNIGAGRIVYQDLTRIDREIRRGDFFHNPLLVEAIDRVRHKHSSLHLLGLLSDGGVHSHINHLFALLELAKRRELDRVYIHAFLDGRDVPPASALEYIDQLEAKLKELGIGKIASVGGRYWGMDRDRRWDRVQKHYCALVLGEGVTAGSARQAVEESYRREETDEFVQPTVIVSQGKPVGVIDSGDSVIFFNFRADRAREITRALVEEDFDGFPRPKWPRVFFVCMTQYDITIPAPVAYPPQSLDNTLGEVLSRRGLRQLRIAETEKYAHVTFFFNGGVEEPNPGEDRILIPSPKVPTYDMQPEMSAGEVTERVIEEIRSGRHDVIILNYANADMVGHTGSMEAAVKAINTLDRCLEKVVEEVLSRQGTVLVTADHGNAEAMRDPVTGEPHTAHTSSPVPFILVDRGLSSIKLKPGGALEDIAPTMLQLLGIPKPAEMTGQSLIES
ncbi:MAG: 2,3-bisphosphoglycerate-independent phosphoglycerate mutase [Syntrophomonadaceae bacterium]|nr:2,3-bisphosphoglycerate-independent phosphoglycerate mutase [Syntrophomonadaceae bacterium]